MHKIILKLGCVLLALAGMNLHSAWADVQDEAAAHVRQALLHAHPQWSAHGAALQIQIHGLRGSALQTCAHPWTWGPVVTTQWKRMQVPVRCGSARGSLVANVQAQATVWVLRRDLPQGHKLLANDLKATAQTVHSPDALQPLAHWQGQPLRQAQSAGSIPVIRPQARAVYVRKGQRIEIQAAHGDVRVSAPGVALRAAKHGETLQVRNLASQAVISGEAIAPGVVRASEQRIGGVKVELESND